MMKNEFERTINASDLQEWIMCTFPDWCEGDVRLIYDHIDDMPSAQPEQTEMIKEIRKWINSANRGNADYFIVDKIEEIINRYE